MVEEGLENSQDVTKERITKPAISINKEAVSACSHTDVRLQPVKGPCRELPQPENRRDSRQGHIGKREKHDRQKRNEPIYMDRHT